MCNVKLHKWLEQIKYHTDLHTTGNSLSITLTYKQVLQNKIKSEN